MDESITGRRSSIPILKQSNKTKSFQSFVSLNLQSNSSSSSSPPILENPKMVTKARTTSHAPKLEIDNDIVITKLCDENKRFKEEQTHLLSKYEEALRENQEIQNKNDELQRETISLRRGEVNLKAAIENLHKEQLNLEDKNKKLLKKLEEILPDSSKDIIKENSRHATDDASRTQDILTELEKLKSYLVNVELQLYEANEHISDLIEKNHEMEAENNILKKDNAEMDRLKAIMQSNVHKTHSIKRMEETFLPVKPERADLMKRITREDSSGGNVDAMNNETIDLKSDLRKQNKSYEAQFIEYVSEFKSFIWLVN